MCFAAGVGISWKTLFSKDGLNIPVAVASGWVLLPYFVLKELVGWTDKLWMVERAGALGIGPYLCWIDEDGRTIVKFVSHLGKSVS